jgi:hypothetical protein
MAEMVLPKWLTHSKPYGGHIPNKKPMLEERCSSSGSVFEKVIRKEHNAASKALIHPTPDAPNLYHKMHQRYLVPFFLQAIDSSKELVGLLISGFVLGSWTSSKGKAA